MNASYDYLIIGTGFGGSISAYRVAQAQQRAGKPISVCVLEQGKRYHRGEFPRNLLRTRQFWWANEGQRGWQGLYHLRTGDNISILTSNGVGGTSLIYLDVQFDAYAKAFDFRDKEGRYRWPRSVDWRAEMPQYYARLERALHPVPIPDPPLKALALRAGGTGVGLGSKFKLVPLAVYFGQAGSERGVLHEDPYGGDSPFGPGGAPQVACQMCGECLIGCNTHSKNTPDLTYLWFAEQMGVEVYSRHHVSQIEPLPGGGYRVWFEDLRFGNSLGGYVDARRVIVAAGSPGSTELLLRAKHGYRRGRRQYMPTLPRLSDMLGQYFSGNGDFGGVGFRTNRITNPEVGPTITALLDCRDERDGQGFVIEEGGVPSLLRANLRRYPTGSSVMRRFVQRVVGLLPARQNRLSVEIFDFLGLDALQDALPYLSMGIDGANGSMRIDGEGRLVARWEPAVSLEYFQALEQRLRAVTESPQGLNGTFLSYPPYAISKNLLTVHPLGGCPMGESADGGVVNPDGEVFGYPGLYVADGAVIPSAVGPNPSKTIGAVTERIVERMAQRGI